MTLTVRLQPDLASALELHCAERGVTKSLVVQQVLAEYLARPGSQRGARRAAATAQAAEPSANYRAFEASGLIGCVEGVGRQTRRGARGDPAQPGGEAGQARRARCAGSGRQAGKPHQASLGPMIERSAVRAPTCGRCRRAMRC